MDINERQGLPISGMHSLSWTFATTSPMASLASTSKVTARRLGRLGNLQKKQILGSMSRASSDVRTAKALLYVEQSQAIVKLRAYRNQPRLIRKDAFLVLDLEEESAATSGGKTPCQKWCSSYHRILSKICGCVSTKGRLGKLGSLQDIESLG